MSLGRGWLAAGAAGLLAATHASGQADATRLRQLERQMQDIDRTLRVSVPPDQPIAERLLLDAGGSLRFGFYGIDDPRSNGRYLRQYDGRLYARVELDGAHRFFGRLRFQYDDFNEGDSFDGEGDDFNDPVLERLWYEFDLRGLQRARTGVSPDYNLNIRGGKQLIFWGSGLVLSQTVHGGTVDVEIGPLGFTGLGAITASMEVVDFDGSRPDFDDNTKRGFYGGQFEYRGLPDHRPYLFFVQMSDHNDNNQAVIAGIPTRFDYEAQYLGLGSRGSLGPALAYRVELIKQFGRGLSSPFDPFVGVVAQTKEDIDAWAGVLGLTYLFRDVRDTRLDFEVIGGSGDDDRLDSGDTFGGNRSGTDDNSFVALGYLNTGLALAPEVSNLLSFRFGASTSPFQNMPGLLENLRVGFDGFVFFKTNPDAPISVLTEDERFVGGETDFYIDWRVTSDITATVRYGVFWPGDAMPTGLDDPRQYLYAGISYAF